MTLTMHISFEDMMFEDHLKREKKSINEAISKNRLAAADRLMGLENRIK